MKVAVAIVLSLTMTTKAMSLSPNRPLKIESSVQSTPQFYAYKQRYQEILLKEKRTKDSDSIIEKEISGAITFLVGTYGLYATQSTVLTRFIYATAQSAGITLASSAYYDLNSPSLFLSIDQILHRSRGLDEQAFQRLIVENDRQKAATSNRIFAYTATSLMLLNGYNGYREQENNSKTLSNIFYFLSFNFALIATFNYYKIFSGDDKNATTTKESSIELTVIPNPGIIYRF